MRFFTLNNLTNKCYLPESLSFLIIDNATVSDIVFGVGATAVKAKNYVIPFPTGTVYMTATADTCVPLTENVVGSFGNGQYTFVYFISSQWKMGMSFHLL